MPRKAGDVKQQGQGVPCEETDREDRKVARAARATTAGWARPARATCAGHGTAVPPVQPWQGQRVPRGTAVPPLRWCGPMLNTGVFVLVEEGS